ncbi:putative F-box domain-containing protein [Rosa chinensis]|uniref:Putative F-box domain-containing protein n=1 Tax=Rosa chinensis TaxID=74649 RepID=A0A2P6Q780_ROSCH|nr:putative F-box domain-containing protein [Rosa chinensis]
MITKKPKTRTVEEAISTLEGSGWAWLPRDILDLILERLIQIKDYIRFGVVCKHWRSIALHQNMQSRLESCHKLPPLMIFINQYDNGTSVALHSGTQDKTSRFKLKLNGFPIYDLTKDCGSSHGWLAYADATLEVTLLNPFTGCTITLPPVRTTHGHYIKKVVLSADPSLCPDDFEALVMYMHYSCTKLIKLAHFKSGQDAWTRIDHRRMELSYAMYYRGKFLIWNDHCEICSVDDSSKGTKVLLDYRWVLLAYRSLYVQDSRIYLVESSKGDLLLIMKGPSSEDLHINVFKLLSDLNNEFKCLKIESIGYDALFLDRNQSICVSALEFPECHPNSIYFVNGTFNLENQKMHWRYLSIPTLSAIWSSPTICFENRLYQQQMRVL